MLHFFESDPTFSERLSLYYAPPARPREVRRKAFLIPLLFPRCRAPGAPAASTLCFRGPPLRPRIASPGRSERFFQTKLL